MNRKRILVTGHRGYIGAVMVPMLQQAGYDVVGMDIDLYRRCTYGDPFESCPGIEKDVRDVEPNDLRGFDAVFHLAALSNDPLGNLNPEVTYDINFKGSVRMAEAAKKAGVPRFIFSSSCSNYGSAGDNLVDENAQLNPITPYGKSKVMSEAEIGRMADDAFCPVYLRNATAYGFAPRNRFDIVLNNLTAWATTTGKVYLKSDGTPWRPIVHIADITRAFIATLEAPREIVFNQAFNVGRQEENYRIREIAEVVAKVVPDCHIEYAPGAGPDLRCYRVDCSKITRLVPGFKPTWTALEGAKELYAAYHKYGLSVEEFEGPRYKRIDHIKMLMNDGYLDENIRWTRHASSVTR